MSSQKFINDQGIGRDFVCDIQLSSTSSRLKLYFNQGDDIIQVVHKFLKENHKPTYQSHKVLHQIFHKYVYSSDKLSAPNQNNPNIPPVCTGEKCTDWTMCREFVSFEGDFDVMKTRNKIFEMNLKMESEKLQITRDEINDVANLTELTPSECEHSVQIMKRLLQWPNELLFPILDIVRLAVRREDVCSVLVTPEFIKRLVGSYSKSPENQLITTYCFVNMLSHSFGATMIHSQFLDIVRELCKITEGSGNLQVALSSLFLNLTITLTESADQEMSQNAFFFTECVLHLLTWTTNFDSIYQSLQSLANLTTTPFKSTIIEKIISAEVVTCKIRDYVNASPPCELEKLNRVANFLWNAISAQINSANEDTPSSSYATTDRKEIFYLCYGDIVTRVFCHPLNYESLVEKTVDSFKLIEPHFFYTDAENEHIVTNTVEYCIFHQLNIKRLNVIEGIVEVKKENELTIKYKKDIVKTHRYDDVEFLKRFIRDRFHLIEIQISYKDSAGITVIIITQEHLDIFNNSDNKMLKIKNTEVQKSCILA